MDNDNNSLKTNMKRNISEIDSNPIVDKDMDNDNNNQSNKKERKVISVDLTSDHPIPVTYKKEKKKNFNP